MLLLSVEILSLIIILIVLYNYYKKYINNVLYVKSDIDNREYLVLNEPDKNDASNTIAKLRQNLILLKDHLAKNYPDKEETNLILKRLNPDYISEGSPITGEITYTSNKGESMVVCLRNPDLKLHNLNLLSFVMIHELAHIAQKDYDYKHSDKFIKIFIFLLKESINIGIYKYEDYRKNPINYCGMNLNTTPI